MEKRKLTKDEKKAFVAIGAIVCAICIGTCIYVKIQSKRVDDEILMASKEFIDWMNQYTT